MNSNEIIKGDIRTVGELINALSNLPKEMIFIGFFDEARDKDGNIANKATYKGVGFTVGKGSNNLIYNEKYALLERTIEYNLVE